MRSRALQRTWTDKFPLSHEDKAVLTSITGIAVEDDKKYGFTGS
jgi:hypothetical protein